MKYELDQKFFDTWSEGSAYALGYLYADGSIYRGKGKRNELIISASKEENILCMKSLLQADHPIRRTGDNSYQLRIGSIYLIHRLESLGLVEGKVQNIIYPSVPEMYEKAFIRGYFDGKGSFMVERGRRVVSNFSCGCLSFIESLRDRLVTYGLNRASVHQYGAGKSTNQIRYYVKDTERLYELMYTGARIYSSSQRTRYEQGYKE